MLSFCMFSTLQRYAKKANHHVFGTSFNHIYHISGTSFSAVYHIFGTSFPLFITFSARVSVSFITFWARIVWLRYILTIITTSFCQPMAESSEAL